MHDARWIGRGARRGPRMAGFSLTVAALLAVGAPVAAQDAVPEPSRHMGFQVGADSVLADWSQIESYLSALAGTSPYARLDTIGQTTLGRPLLLVTLTAPANQARLEAIREGQACLADPRGLAPATEDSLVRHAPVVVFINNNLHSTEIGSSQFSTLLAHRLATDERYQGFLEDVVILMVPSANPDGLDTVVGWYRQYQGTPFEGGPLPWLYHAYAGHDNNRDWYMFTQVETQALARVLYREWFPQIVWDVHQMGNRGARLFLPPFSDPVNPNLDPMIVEGTSLVGTFMAAAVLDAGRTGVAHQARFDLWWHGGFRTVPARHNMIGILSEAASANLASPVFQEPDELRQDDAGVNYPAPWEGGWWRLGDIIEYELLAADGLLQLAATERASFLRRFVSVGRRAVAAGEAGNPYAYVIPPDQRDPAAAALLANTLIMAGIEVHAATAAFGAAGRRYASGTYVVPMGQPFRAHAKDLLERQVYPDRREYPDGPPVPPYDVAGWTLPLQMGVATDAIAEPFRFEGEVVSWAVTPRGVVRGRGAQRVLANRANAESRTLADALRAGARAWVTREPVRIGDTSLPAGSLVLEHAADPALLDSIVAANAATYGFDAWAADGLRPQGPVIDRLPRIGLYKPWTASGDEGWTRWVFEQHGIPFVTVTDATVRAGQLTELLDVLVLPDLGGRGSDGTEAIVSGRSLSSSPPEYAGGIGEEGARHVEAFVRGGGVLVTLDGSSDFAMSRLNLPVSNGLASGPQAARDSRFYAPGSIFEVALESGMPLTSGMGDSVAVYFTNSAAFVTESPARVLGWYQQAPLRSGYALNQELLAGKAALVEVPVGRGRAILFGFRPQYRGQSHGTFKLLFNALLLRAAD